jgi:DNA-binding MarR family transcriptional regulator
MSKYDRQKATAVRALSEAVSLAHFRINAVIEAIYGGGAGIAAERAVLRNVVVRGPMTVPVIAALRPVSRQYIQTIVDGLAAQGLVAFTDNPAHRRSKLVTATAAGAALLAEMDRQGDPLLSAAADAVGASAEDVRKATALLEGLNAHMDRLIAAGKRGGDDAD